MLNNISIVATQVAILFILISIGFVSNKIKLFSDKTIKQMTDFVLYIVMPCVIANSFRRDFDPDIFKAILVTFAAAFFCFFLNILLGHLFIHDKIKSKEKVLRYGAVFSNAGFMAIPLQQALLGEDGVLYGAIFVAVFNIVNWTYGVILMSGDIKTMSVKKAILNPGIIATAIGFFIYLAPFNLPEIVGKPIEYMAALNTPLPMVIIGYHLANSNFKIKGFQPYFTMAFRLILSPLLILGLLYLVKIDKTIMISIIVAASAPFAATNTMFCEKFGADTKLSASLVSVTTVLSIITMPIVIAIAMNL